MHASLDGELINGQYRTAWDPGDQDHQHPCRASQREKWRDRDPGQLLTARCLHYLAVTEYEFAVLKAQAQKRTVENVMLVIEDKALLSLRRKRSRGGYQECLVEAERRFWELRGHAVRRPDLILPAIWEKESVHDGTEDLQPAGRGLYPADRLEL